MQDETSHFLSSLRAAFGWSDQPMPVVETGEGALPSAYAVTPLATAAVALAGGAAAELSARFAAGRGRGGAARGGAARGGAGRGVVADGADGAEAAAPTVTVDRRLASAWFGFTIAPRGWELPPIWDPIAGDYRCADGWVRLHTNAPHHRAAAETVLGATTTRSAVAAAVGRWRGADLEDAIVTAGGCAAYMRSGAAWSAHAQGSAVAAGPLVELADGSEGPRQAWATTPRNAGQPLLAGVRVLDLTRILAGPVATRFLAGLGAQVLRVDPPGWEEPSIAPEVTLGKRCCRLDLRRAEDHAVLVKLLGQAHVVVHGYRSDALERLGLGQAERAAIAPGLIDVCLDAYGWGGPWAQRRGFDSLVQMSTGIAEQGRRLHPANAGLSPAELEDRPPVPLPVQALDHATGYLLAAAALAGLARRSTGGPGLVARASLAATAALLVGGPAGSFGDELAPLGPDDLAPGLEETGWGPARRIRPPLRIGDRELAWSLPACRLGAHPARWSPD